MRQSDKPWWKVTRCLRQTSDRLCTSSPEGNYRLKKHSFRFDGLQNQNPNQKETKFCMCDCGVRNWFLLPPLFFLDEHFTLCCLLGGLRLKVQKETQKQRTFLPLWPWRTTKESDLVCGDSAHEIGEFTVLSACLPASLSVCLSACQSVFCCTN